MTTKRQHEIEVENVNYDYELGVADERRRILSAIDVAEMMGETVSIAQVRRIIEGNGDD